MKQVMKVAMGLMGLVVLPACGVSSTLVSGASSTGIQSLGSSTVAAPSTPGSLTPSIPASFRSGINHCGDPYALNATTARGTIPLLDCPGFAGLRPTPSLTVESGDRVLISGLSASEMVTTQSSAVRPSRDGTFVAVQPGRAIVTIHNHPCVPAPSGQQRESCTLLVISVHSR